jgi:small-conductance mechanosensitive channel
MRIFSRAFALKMLLAAAVLSGFGSGQAVPAADTPTAKLPDAQQIIRYLNQALDWYHHLTVEQQMANEPSDMVFLNDDAQISRQILQLAFDFARAQAQLLSSEQGPQAPEVQTSEPGEYQALVGAAAKADADVQQTRAELAAERQKLAKAGARARKKLRSAIAELQSETDMVQSRSQMLHRMVQFVSGAGANGRGDLLAQIDQLQRSVPELETEAAKPAGGATPAARDQTAAQPPRPTGILSLVEDLFALRRKVNILNQVMRSTDALAESSQALRQPIVENLRAIVKRGDELAKQADTSNPAQLAEVKRQLDSLNASFQQVSAGFLPLAKKTVLFEQHKANLERWRSTIRSQNAADLRSLILRLVGFGVIIGAVVVVSNLWRKATFRYVRDAHRRYQFLLVRRIVMWCAIGITVAFALATEIGSLATFAGLITAGIAVSLQNVILAVVGYFFLIGKYGVRVGDRVQIAGVTGDVVDIGLVRLHLMEVGGAGSGRQLTGRTVVFSNAVVFQPNVSFFRQIPGTNFVWHQVSLTLAPESDYASVRKRMLEAVESVYAGYRESIKKQNEQMARLMNVELPAPRPYSDLRMTQSGIQVIVTYPIDRESAADIDDQVMRELLNMIREMPELKLAGSGTPDIQPVREQKAA